jgi:hypothetical protein
VLIEGLIDEEMRASWPGLHQNAFSGQHRRPVFKQPPVAKFITTKGTNFNRSTTSSMTETQHSASTNYLQQHHQRLKIPPTAPSAGVVFLL